MKIIIMSGIPGSGKTTWVETNIGEYAYLSTDDLHMDNGIYRFQPDRLAEFHDKIYRTFIQHCLQPTHDVLVVDNTNIRKEEFVPYLRIGSAYAHTVLMVRIYCTPEIAASRCTHGVPYSKIQAMAASMEPVDARWPVQHVLSNGLTAN